ncbi:MAG: FAD-dependent oxidoreductase [Cyanobacteria bacterium J06648_16]
MSNVSPQRWAVIGNGLVGQTLAHRLAQAGQTVTLFASPGELGALTAVEPLDSLSHDPYPWIIRSEDVWLRERLRELDLESDLRWFTAQTGLLARRQLYPVSMGAGLLKLALLRPVGRIRLALTLAGLRCGGPTKLGNVEWLRHWSGRRIFRQIWQPLLRSQLGDSYYKVAVPYLWAAVLGPSLRQTPTQFGYLQGGYGHLAAAHRVWLQSAGVSLCDRAVGQIWRDPAIQQIRVKRLPPTASGADCHDPTCARIQSFDQVVVTTGTPTAVNLCRGLTQREQRQLSQVPYLGLVCLSLLLNRSLSPCTITHIAGAAPFDRVVEGPDRRGIGYPVYLLRYVRPTDRIFALPDAVLADEYLTALARLHPRFEPSQVLRWRLVRTQHAIALPTPSALAQPPPIHTTIPGLHLLSSAHAPTGILSLDHSLQLAETHLAPLLTAAATQAPSTTAV